MNSTLFAVIMAMFVVASQSFLQSKIQSSDVGKSFLSMVAVGEAAPDFELKNSQGDYRSKPSSFNSLIVFYQFLLGKSFKLSSFKGKKPVVVFFYPADNTPGCTTEV